jgi:hypothetical protein
LVVLAATFRSRLRINHALSLAYRKTRCRIGASRERSSYNLLFSGPASAGLGFGAGSKPARSRCCRVGPGNCTPAPHGTGRKASPLDLSGSCHSMKATAFRRNQRVHPVQLTQPGRNASDPLPPLRALPRFISVGSEVARLRAGHRPPLKLHVQFSRMQLSRRVTSGEMQWKGLTEQG